RRGLGANRRLGLPALGAVLGRRGGAIGEQPEPEVGVDPRPRHDPRAVARPDPRLVGVDDGVERGWVDEALVDEERLERPDAQLDVAQWRVVVAMLPDVVVVVVVIWVLVRHG